MPAVDRPLERLLVLGIGYMLSHISPFHAFGAFGCLLLLLSVPMWRGLLSALLPEMTIDRFPLAEAEFEGVLIHAR